MAAAPPPPPRAGSWRVQLRIRCTHLKKLDVLSKSDPLAVVYVRPGPGAAYAEVGRTETLRDNSRPDFQKEITIDYYFNQLQELKFSIFDSDEKGQKLEPIGHVETTLGKIMSAPGHRLVSKLEEPSHPGKDRGTILVTAQPFDEGSVTTFQLQLRGQNLDKKDLLGKSDPFYRLFRKEQGVLDSHAWTKLVESEVVMSNLNPLWKPFTITDTRLCGGDVALPLRIEVYDWDRASDPDLIGIAETSVGGLIEAQRNKVGLELINPKKKEHGNTVHGIKLFAGKYVNSGLLFVESFVTMPRAHTFLDFLNGGLQLNVNVAIDFTGSNGTPSDSHSLHYHHKDGRSLNPYQSVIVSVGNILSSYDVDQQYPCFGFGAQVGGSVSHCFSLNGNPANPCCVGVPGIFAAYQQAIHTLPLSGPTFFAPVIRAITDFAFRSRSSPVLQYQVLLLITDGEINDMPATIDAVVSASTQPMSIIIVGVGNADFKCMQFLDSDKQPLRGNNGAVCVRDIVQFVAFRDFPPSNPAALAAAVLEELPNQVVQFFRMNNVAPQAPPPPPQI